LDTLILRCTHYPLLKETIQSKIGKKVNIIDSALTVAERVKTYIEANPDIDNLLTKHDKTEFYVSDITEQFKETASTILKRKIHLEQVKI